MDNTLAQLLEQMESLLKAHEGLLGLVRRKQQAIRLGQPDLVSETCTLENEHVQRIAELEKQRQRMVGELTQQLAPNATEPLRLRQIADEFPEPTRGQLLVLHQRLRQTMQTIQRENAVSRRAADGLLRHMKGIVQQVTQAAGGATYGRRGSIAPAATSVNSLSLTA